ncbi:MAG: DNA repair protein [Myxococcales bacterium]|nr:DNA repair protein [Myxococcales bacterium]
MSTDPTDVEQGEQTADLAGTNYEVIRRRLNALGDTLSDKAGALNEKRQEMFASEPLAPRAGSEPIRTEHLCKARDIVNLGGRVLFGYNINMRRTQTTTSDVMGLHTLNDDGEQFEFTPLGEDSPTNFLQDEGFQRHFKELYSFYKDTQLLQLRTLPGRLLAVFQIGSTQDDVRVFRWRVEANGAVQYIDNSGVDDNVRPPSQDFEWIATRREDQVLGTHPHLAIKDQNGIEQLFVETVGGDLTIKIEDNTEDGEGIYSEPVEDQYQSLSDAQILYAHVDRLILLKIRPYRENNHRYLIFNPETKTVPRLDAIEQACQRLPEAHGIIYPGGIYLSTDELYTATEDVEGMHFERSVRSPNGEDVLYVFHGPGSGEYLLLSYNLIQKRLQNPIRCHGYCLFDDGRMIVFQSDEEPTQYHRMRIWQTPYVSDEVAAEIERQRREQLKGSELAKVGNAELVRGISDALSICRTISNQEPTLPLYQSLITAVDRSLKNYYWLGYGEVGLEETLRQVRSTAALVLDEFEKVVSLQKQANAALAEATEQQLALIRGQQGDYDSIDRYVEGLDALRKHRGHLITMREMRYMDLERLAEMEEEIVEQDNEMSRRTVRYLLDDRALAPYRGSIQEIIDSVPSLTKTTDANWARDKLDEITEGLNLLNDVVSGLETDDPTDRTTILTNIAEVLSQQNRARAMLDGQRKKLQESEGKAEFAAQFALFSQSVTSALSMCDNPEKCDEQLTRLMVQLEDLESRFAAFDMFLEDLAVKRDEVLEIFEARKQALQQERQQRAQNIHRAAERSLQGIQRRAARMESADDLNAFFATNTTKIREMIQTLRDLKDNVRADDIESQLGAARDQALRSLRDKKDLFAEGEGVIKLGGIRFSVNTQALELTMLPRDGQMMLHLTGTDFYEAVDDPKFLATRECWEQRIVSESPEVYRGEFLAASIFFDAEENRNGMTIHRLHEGLGASDGLLSIVREYATDRYDEGYERGVHDADAALILEKLLALHTTTGLLRFNSRARALACLFWGYGVERDRADLWTRRARSLGRLRETFGHATPLAQFGEELAEKIGEFLTTHALTSTDEEVQQAGLYLAEELVGNPLHFVTSLAADRLRDAFLTNLDGHNTRRDFEDDLRAFEKDIGSRMHLATGWLQGFVDRAGGDLDEETREAVPEAATLMLTQGRLARDVSAVTTTMKVTGLLGQHPRIEDQSLVLKLDTFTRRLRRYMDERVPKYKMFREEVQRVLEEARDRMRLDALKPSVLTTFVRNKLINDVYLPEIGSNLSQQMGSLDGDQGSARSGLLLLISPPGYGKTTLMEYIAERMGLVFMKINGPALGHNVISLDPAEAPNATARQEVERLNMAFEMGNNVMLYLDDIQHSNPEFLQKFIPLCDANRKIEGVWKGKPSNYDMRGKRFCVIMAGNPYTETGEKFTIPDMLANRAKTMNLGDILSGRDEEFSLSYIENALTANAVLAPLSTREMSDTYALIRMAQGREVAPSDLKHSYSGQELNEVLNVLKMLFKAQDVLLQVNQAYIESAAQDDAYRTEPPFKLQGSYRNMSRIAQLVTGITTDDEMEQIIDDHYKGESQTLTTGAQSNLLRLAEMRDRMSADQKKRLEEIRAEFRRRQLMGGGEDDPVARVAGPLSGLVQNLQNVEAALKNDTVSNHLGTLVQRFDGLEAALTRNTVGPQLDQLGKQLGAQFGRLETAIGRGGDVSAQLDKLGKQLGAIRTTLTSNTGLEQHLASMNGTMGQLVSLLQELPTQQQPTQVMQAIPAEGGGGGGQDTAQLLMPVLEKLSQSLEALALTESRIQIVNEAPDDIRRVLNHQIEIMEWTLVPLVRTMAQDLQLSSDSWSKLTELLARMKMVNQQFGHHAPRDLPTSLDEAAAREAKQARGGKPPARSPRPPAQATKLNPTARKPGPPGSTQELPAISKDVDDGWFNE